ncbi:MAG TPA: hypothetical protein VF815_05570 [Myxococcaceae bacterium]
MSNALVRLARRLLRFRQRLSELPVAIGYRVAWVRIKMDDKRGGCTRHLSPMSLDISRVALANILLTRATA